MKIDKPKRTDDLYVLCLRDLCDAHHIKLAGVPFTQKELLTIYPRWLCLQAGNNLCLRIQEAR